MKDYSAFKEALGLRESSNNYSVKNQFGYLGRWQFGKMRLSDFGLCKKIAKSWQWNFDLTDDIFLNTPVLQDAIFDAHVSRLHNVVIGLFKPFINKHHEHQFFTTSGMIAVMHLLGMGGLAKLIQGNDSCDANKTKASGYLKLFAGYEIPDNLPRNVRVMDLLAKQASLKKLS